MSGGAGEALHHPSQTCKRWIPGYHRQLCCAPIPVPAVPPSLPRQCHHPCPGSAIGSGAGPSRARWAPPASQQQQEVLAEPPAPLSSAHPEPCAAVTPAAPGGRHSPAGPSGNHPHFLCLQPPHSQRRCTPECSKFCRKRINLSSLSCSPSSFPFLSASLSPSLSLSHLHLSIPIPSPCPYPHSSPCPPIPTEAAASLQLLVAPLPS